MSTTMKRKVAKLRLSPNEEAQLIREEHERRRKLRIQQVREQQKYIAQQVRQEVEQRRQHELELLEKELRAEWEQQQRQKVNKLHRLYQESLSLLGQGHRSANENDPNLTAIAQKESNDSKAEVRYRKALKELKLQRLKNLENESRSIDARKKALQTEKLRSAKIASLALPPSRAHQDFGSKPQHVVKKCDASAFAATHYHMPDTLVDKAMAKSQPNAHIEAELEVERLQDKKREKDQKKEEQMEKARLRGRQALRKEQLVQDHERLLDELEHMQLMDLLRRRQQVCDMSRQIFEPLYKRKETEEDFQREIEFAFEDMYTGERRVKGDLLVQLVPEPLPTPSTRCQDQDLDITQDELLPSENAAYEIEDESIKEKAKGIKPVPAGVGPAPRRALKRLLDRIQNQRHEWTSPTLSTDQTPKREISIDTSSMSSVERDKLFLEVKQASTVNMNHSDALAKPIQDFEDQKKKEEELERKKQKQIVFLQELEDQRVKLEQQLLEAQKERELLKATLTQKVSHDPTSNNQPVPPVGDNTRRKKECRPQLLQQNVTHQKSLEVARQRLEDYQRALRVRYSLPTVLPQGFYDSSVRSFTPAVQIQPPIPVEAQEKTQISVKGPMIEKDILDPPLGSDMPADLKTLPAKAHIMRSLQNLPKCVATEISSNLSTTNVSIHSSSNSDQVTNLGVEEGMERHELQDVWIKQQTENGVLLLQQEHERLGLEQQQRQKEELEQTKLQKSTLKALINMDAQVSQEMIQARSKLLKSLLKTLEKSNGGTLHPETPQHQTSTGAAAKPSVTRVKLWNRMTEQHELSVIEEVQTPANLSLVTDQEDILAVNQDFQQNCESSIVTGLTIQTHSGACKPVLRRECFLRTGTSPGPGSAQHIISPLPSDSGRGADYSGPVVTSFHSPVEHAHRLHDADSLSTTLSTGSYITTDLDQKSEPDSGSLCVQAPGSSLSHQMHQSQERDTFISPEGIPLDKVRAPRPPQLTTLGAAVEMVSAQDQFLNVNQGHESFRPLIAQLAEQSSCMAEDQTQAAIEHLVGHPSAHSSMIGQLPAYSFISDHKSICQISRRHRFVALSMDQLEQCTMYADECQKEEARILGVSASDSFLPLNAELTDNQTENAKNLEIPEHLPHSAEEHFGASTYLSSSSDPTEFEQSQEKMRAEEYFSSATLFHTPHQSFSQCHPNESPAAIAVKLTAQSLFSLSDALSKLHFEDGSRTVDSVEQKGILEQSEITLESLTDSLQDTQESAISEDPDPTEYNQISASDMTAVEMTKLRLWDESEMHQRTQSCSNSQETYKINRMKAKEFQKKTLLKLHAKHMQQKTKMQHTSASY